MDISGKSEVTSRRDVRVEIIHFIWGFCAHIVTSRRDVRVEIVYLLILQNSGIVTSRRDVRVEIYISSLAMLAAMRHISQRCESRNVLNLLPTQLDESSHISQRCESRNLRIR